MGKAAIAVAWIGAVGVVGGAVVTTGLPLLAGKKADSAPVASGPVAGSGDAKHVSVPSTSPADSTTTDGSGPADRSAAESGGASKGAPTQTDATYVGVVVSATDQQPIADASVTLLGRGGDPATTNPSGCFTLTFGQLQGASTLFVSASGFQARSFDIDLSGDAAKDAEIALQPKGATTGSAAQAAPMKPMTLKLSPRVRRLMIQGVRPITTSTAALVDKKSWLRPAKQPGN